MEKSHGLAAALQKRIHNVYGAVWQKEGQTGELAYPLSGREEPDGNVPAKADRNLSSNAKIGSSVVGLLATTLQCFPNDVG